MSSSVPFVAYAFDTPQSPEALELRLRAAEGHLAGLFATSLARHHVGDGQLGFCRWVPQGDSVDWPAVAMNADGQGSTWIHMPSLARQPGSGADAGTLADAYFAGRVRRDELAAPFAVVRRRRGSLEISNDIFGLVRLFEYRFGMSYVWSTRMGLAHVFMGEDPAKNVAAWAGMATIGWAPGGVTQMGDGRQLPAATTVRASADGASVRVVSTSEFGDWLQAERARERPSASEIIDSMAPVLLTARRWPTEPVADLSGGKDSRAVAAVGLVSGAIRLLRTVATDSGEVETAQTLVSMVEFPVEHEIVPLRDAALPTGPVVERIRSQNVAWEGRYLATTTLKSSPFTGFRGRSRARFNGLGGEVVGGGNLLGAWRERLAEGKAQVAGNRLAALTRNGRGAAASARQTTEAIVRGYVDRAADMGIDTALGVVDLFYNIDRMPNWSNTFATDTNLCPLYASGLVRLSAHTLGAPVPSGDVHRAIIGAAVPQWLEVPFYKPTQSRRLEPMAWQYPEWGEVRSLILEKSEALSSYDPEAVAALVGAIDAGEAGPPEDVFVRRFVWEVTFDHVIADVQAHAARLRAALAQLAG